MYDTYRRKKIEEENEDQNVDDDQNPDQNIYNIKNSNVNDKETPEKNMYIYNNSEPPKEDNEDDDEEYNFNFVMTFSEEGINGLPLPEMIQLKEKFVHESSFMKKHSFPKALQFHKPNRPMNLRSTCTVN